MAVRAFITGVSGPVLTDGERAFLRAELWNPDTWRERVRVSFGNQLAPKLGGDAALAERIDAGIAAGMKDL